MKAIYRGDLLDAGQLIGEMDNLLERIGDRLAVESGRTITSDHESLIADVEALRGKSARRNTVVLHGPPTPVKVVDVMQRPRGVRARLRMLWEALTL